MNLTLPELGEGIEEATVSTWYFNEGDEIKKDEDVVEVATDKATFNIPAPAGGLLKKILLAEGDIAKTGQVLAEIG